MSLPSPENLRTTSVTPVDHVAERLRILICSTPVEGHVNPATPIARALVERGHDVRWYTGSMFRSMVEATGAVFEPIVAATDPESSSLDERFPERAGIEGMEGLKFDLKHLFLDEVPGQLRDVRRIVDRYPVDLVLADTAFSTASLLHELGGPPFATYGISILPIPSRDLPPIGSGLQPRSSAVRRQLDRLLTPVAMKLLFRDVQRHYLGVRDAIGLPRTRSTVFDTFVSPLLYLHGSAASFEYPRSDLPEQVHFIGPLLPTPKPDAALPSWWPDVDPTKPVVLVNQGTVAVDLDDLVVPSLAALADDDVVVIATGGVGRDGLIAPIPTNAHVESYIPFSLILPHVDVMVTNGGFGGVQLALAHGVPMVVAGATEDKPEIAARVAWSGAGIDLRAKRPTEKQIRDAVWSVLSDERYRGHAARIHHETAQVDAPELAADLIEQLATTGEAVLRSDPSIARARPLTASHA